MRACNGLAKDVMKATPLRLWKWSEVYGALGRAGRYNALQQSA